MNVIRTTYTLPMPVRNWSLPETTVCDASGLSLTRMPAACTLRVGVASIPLWGMVTREPNGLIGVCDDAPALFMKAIEGTTGASIMDEFLSTVTGERREGLIAEIAEAAIQSQWRLSA